MRLRVELAGSRHRFACLATVEEQPAEGIGTAAVFGHPATVKTFPEAPLHEPVYPAILKEPNVVVEPQITAAGSSLSCTQGEWEGDHPGASVFAAPTSVAIQWRKSSTPIPGATGSSFTATESGSHSCEVTAENAAGATHKASKSAATFPKAPTATSTTQPKAPRARPR